MLIGKAVAAIGPLGWRVGWSIPESDSPNRERKSASLGRSAAGGGGVFEESTIGNEQLAASERFMPAL